MLKIFSSRSLYPVAVWTKLNKQRSQPMRVSLLCQLFCESLATPSVEVSENMPSVFKELCRPINSNSAQYHESVSLTSSALQILFVSKRHQWILSSFHENDVSIYDSQALLLPHLWSSNYSRFMAGQQCHIQKQWPPRIISGASPATAWGM